MPSAPPPPPPPDAGSDSERPARTSRKRLIALAVAVTALLATGAAGAWYLMGRPAPPKDEPAKAAATPRKPVFVVLDPFTVNLRDEHGERFAQVGVTLEIEGGDGGDVDARLKDHMPAVRNNVLLLLSSKRIEELLTLEGKQALAGEVRQAIVAAIDPARAATPAGATPVRTVLFSQFIVQ